MAACLMWEIYWEGETEAVSWGGCKEEGLGAGRLRLLLGHDTCVKKLASGVMAHVHRDRQ